MPLQAESISVDSSVFVERREDGALRLERAARFGRGDQVVTVVSWNGSRTTGYTITSAVPAGLDLQSASEERLQVSTDGGHSWRALADSREVPRGVTHLRWRAGQGDGSLSYRAVVR